MEQKLLALPRSSGILFVGVKVHPGLPPQASVYQIWVGCSRDHVEETIEKLVEVVLQEEILHGAVVRVEARRGVVRELKVVDRG